MNKSRFDNQKTFIDELGELVGHLLDTIAFTSEKTIASIVLLLSMVPETLGVGAAMGYPVGVVSAAVSLVTVKLALRDRGAFYALPWVGKRRLYFGWALYLLNLMAGFAFVYSTGRWVDLFLIVVSFCGAVSSEQIAQIIKAEMRERSTVNLQAAKDAIKLDELRANSQIRVNAKLAKSQTVQQTTGETEKTPNVQHGWAVITEEQRAAGQQSSAERRKAAAQQRQNELYQMLREEFAGQDVDSLNKSALGKRLDVSHATIKRDIDALRNAGVLNGVVA